MKCSIIPYSTEKFLSFEINGKINFVDSSSFLLSSLENLVNNLMTGGTEEFKITKKVFEEKGDFKLLLRKGVYPYNHIRGTENFLETSLPPIETFYNDLTDEPLALDDYHFAHQVWDEFLGESGTLGDYHNLYVMADVTLLADCVEKTRDILWESFNLEICHYLSLPMIAYDAVCKMGRVQLEYLDATMHPWFESAIRGGVCGVGGLRAAEANNQYMGALYDPAKPKSFISIQDINNLYGNFTWL